jgi:hypothetical protein
LAYVHSLTSPQPQTVWVGDTPCPWLKAQPAPREHSAAQADRLGKATWWVRRRCRRDVMNWSSRNENMPYRGEGKTAGQPTDREECSYRSFPTILPTLSAVYYNAEQSPRPICSDWWRRTCKGYFLSVVPVSFTSSAVTKDCLDRSPNSHRLVEFSQRTRWDVSGWRSPGRHLKTSPDRQISP